VRLTSMQIVLLARRAVTLRLFDTHDASPHLPLSGRTGSQREQAAGPLVAPAVPNSECCPGKIPMNTRKTNDASQYTNI
jgi:hypothetical protein